MAIDLTTAQQHLDAWLAADLAAATGQSYKIGQRSLTRTDAAEIKNKINYWQAQVDRLERISSGTPRCRQAVPIDN